MHSSDRTLAAKLGFADPDKKDPDHDLACQYLASEEITRQLVEKFFRPRIAACGPVRKKVEDRYYGTTEVTGERRLICFEYDAALEVPISKGEGKYKTTIGFLDVDINLCAETEEIGKQLIHKTQWRSENGKAVEHKWDETKDYKNEHIYELRMIIEVKVNPVGIGDILRQIALYREYCQATRWLVATTYPMKTIDVSTLEKSNIGHIQLGELFEEWAARIEAEEPEDSGQSSAIVF